MLTHLLVLGLSLETLVKKSQYPPIGAKYHTHFHIPLIGMQNIDFNIKSRRMGDISLYGMVSKQDVVTFKIDKYGNVMFTIGDILQKFMNKYRCEIKSATYDHIADNARMVLRIHPIRFTKEIILSRTNVETSCSEFF